MSIDVQRRVCGRVYVKKNTRKVFGRIYRTLGDFCGVKNYLAPRASRTPLAEGPRRWAKWGPRTTGGPAGELFAPLPGGR